MDSEADELRDAIRLAIVNLENVNLPPRTRIVLALNILRRCLRGQKPRARGHPVD